MIHKDVMGNPVATANVSGYGLGDNQRLVLRSIVKSVDGSKEWPLKDADVSTIVAELDADGWDCEVSEDGFGRPKMDVTHRETAEFIALQERAANDKFSDAERGYIRFGRIPENGRSVNHRDKTPEAGVSVFVAEFTADGDYRVVVDSVQEATYYAVCNREAYRVYGEQVGTGADGEPVVQVTEVKEV